jgi:hypothetical protein
VPVVSIAVILANTTYAAVEAAVFKVNSPVAGANVRISAVPLISAFAAFLQL